jgi:hypothetical protein
MIGKQIAGWLVPLPSSDLRYERSSQSYAFDRCCSALGGQLEMIVIGSAGDQESRELNNHFLDCFQFRY